jgi:hypothetical protein
VPPGAVREAADRAASARFRALHGAPWQAEPVPPGAVHEAADRAASARFRALHGAPWEAEPAPPGVVHEAADRLRRAAFRRGAALRAARWRAPQAGPEAPRRPADADPALPARHLGAGQAAVCRPREREPAPGECRFARRPAIRTAHFAGSLRQTPSQCKAIVIYESLVLPRPVEVIAADRDGAACYRCRWMTWWVTLVGSFGDTL